MGRYLNADILQAIEGSKLIALRTPAVNATGERRSGAIGQGMEFAQHKDYEPGDDLRFLDKSAFIRHRKAVIRQFHAERGLRVSVLLDASASMAVDGAVWARAIEVAAIFGLIAVAGSDRVCFGISRGSNVDWSDVVSSARDIGRQVSWLRSLTPADHVATIGELASRSLDAIRQPGVLIVISDWLVDGYADALRIWRRHDQEVAAIQVLGSLEAGAQGDTGLFQLIDAEAGGLADVVIDGNTWARYHASVKQWSAKVRAAVLSTGGRWISTAVNERLEDSFIANLKRSGLIS